MYGMPGATQLHAGQWQHDALHEATERRRTQRDSDFDVAVAAERARAFQHRALAIAGAVVAALAVIAMV